MTKILNIDINSCKWTFFRPTDLESYWNRIGEDEVDNIPYWLEIWPAAKLLAELVDNNKERFKNKLGLEVGCGLGLVSMVAAKIGSKMVSFDCEYEALYFAKMSQKYNQVRNLLFLTMDWLQPSLKANSVDFILASDVLYEKCFFEPINSLFSQILKPGGFIWLSNPRRDVSLESIPFLETKGWKVQKIASQKISLQDQDPIVEVWQLEQ